MTELSDTTLVTLVGFGGGVLLGLAARLARFCTLGAIEDAYYGGSRDRILMWPLALGVAIFSTFALNEAGLLDLGGSVYLRNAFSLSDSIGGGLVFGIGMALAGNCGFGALSRLGGGDLRSLMIVIVIGIASYAAAVGPLAEMRIWLFPRPEAIDPSSSSLAALLQSRFSLPPLLLAATISIILLIIGLSDRDVRSNKNVVFWSIMVGVAITSGWLGTSWVKTHGFDVVSVESHTFTMPFGEAMLQMMTATGTSGGFSVGSVAGVLVGAFIGARIKKQFRWEACDDPRELSRQLFGAILMGFGGVVALGCSIGQGMSAFSVLAISAPVTIASVAVGAIIGLRFLIEGSPIWETISATLAKVFRQGD